MDCYAIVRRMRATMWMSLLCCPFSSILGYAHSIFYRLVMNNTNVQNYLRGTPMKKSLLLLPFLVVVILTSSQASIPRLISYQGVLTDSLGTPRPDSSYGFVFKLYTVSTGGSAVWTEPKTIGTKKGVFSTDLGDVTTFGPAVTFNVDYWLGVTVGGDPELVPRIRLTAAPYSMTSVNAETAQVALSSAGNWLTSGGNLYFNTGRVGIGTTTPSAHLEVKDTSGSNYSIVVSHATSDAMDVVTYGSGKIALHAEAPFGGLAALAGDAGGILGYPGGIGVRGSSTNNYAVAGFSDTIGVYGKALGANGKGVFGTSLGTGVLGITTSTLLNASGIIGRATASSGPTVGVTGESITSPIGTGIVARGSATGGYFEATTATGWAGIFNGKVQANVLQINGGSDLAEPFETTGDDLIETGTVMVIDESAPGKLTMSTEPYDRKVAGIVSGAGGIKPGITLRQDGVMEGSSLVAIAGRVYCRAEATTAPIRPGDLLTTSAMAGHAMKACEHDRAQGAIIGKAMTGLGSGTGLVLVLVNLQ